MRLKTHVTINHPRRYNLTLTAEFSKIYIYFEEDSFLLINNKEPCGQKIGYSLTRKKYPLKKDSEESQM